MPCCHAANVSAVAGQCARNKANQAKLQQQQQKQQAADARQRRRGGGGGGRSSSEEGYGSADSLETNRPAPVAVPADAPGNWPQGDGANHASPGLAIRRKRAGSGPSFTPIREDSNKSTQRSQRTPRGPVGSACMAVARVFGHISALLNSVTFQTALYIAYVMIFQLLTETLRLKEEYHFDKMIAETFIENHFDSSHNTFESMRRVADFYEWGNTVLLPGLFANAGPCAAHVGAAGHFMSYSDRTTPTDLSAAMAAKGCNDDGWPDGGGAFHLDEATPWSVSEVVEGLDIFDWSEGLVIKQVSIPPFPM